MKTLWIAPLALGFGLVACGELEAPASDARDGVYSMSKDMVNEEGSTITVTVVAGSGSVSPDTVAGVLDGITAVEVNPSDTVDGASPTFDGFVTDEEPLWIPSEIPGSSCAHSGQPRGLLPGRPLVRDRRDRRERHPSV